MLSLIVLTVLLLAVALFALQNAQAVTIRFLFWQLQSSLAMVALTATATGLLIAELFRLASRLLRWNRDRTMPGLVRRSRSRSDPNHSAPPRE
jgi:uncharacterized integral membrane protein